MTKKDHQKSLFESTASDSSSNAAEDSNPEQLTRSIRLNRKIKKRSFNTMNEEGIKSESTQKRKTKQSVSQGVVRYPCHGDLTALSQLLKTNFVHSRSDGPVGDLSHIEEMIEIGPVAVLQGDPEQLMYGVYAKQDITFSTENVPSSKFLVEYVGKTVSETQESDWIYTFDLGNKIINARELRNWSAMVNSAPCQEMAHISIEQPEGMLRIYYKLLRPIKAGEQILAYYGDNYNFKNKRFLHRSDNWQESQEKWASAQDLYEVEPRAIDPILCDVLGIDQQAVFAVPQLDKMIENERADGMALPLLQYDKQKRFLLPQYEQENLTPLHLAGWLGDAEDIKSLLQLGADPARQTSISGYTVAHLVILSPHTTLEQKKSIIECLLEHQASSLLFQDKDNRTILHLAAAEKKDIQLTRYLLKLSLDHSDIEALKDYTNEHGWDYLANIMANGDIALLSKFKKDLQEGIQSDLAFYLDCLPDVFDYLAKKHPNACEEMKAYLSKSFPDFRMTLQHLNASSAQCLNHTVVSKSSKKIAQTAAVTKNKPAVASASVKSHQSKQKTNTIVSKEPIEQKKHFTVPEKTVEQTVEQNIEQTTRITVSQTITVSQKTINSAIEEDSEDKTSIEQPISVPSTSSQATISTTTEKKRPYYRTQGTKRINFFNANENDYPSSMSPRIIESRLFTACVLPYPILMPFFRQLSEIHWMLALDVALAMGQEKRLIDDPHLLSPDQFYTLCKIKNQPDALDVARLKFNMLKRTTQMLFINKLFYKRDVGITPIRHDEDKIKIFNLTPKEHDFFLMSIRDNTGYMLLHALVAGDIAFCFHNEALRTIMASYFADQFSLEGEAKLQGIALKILNDAYQGLYILDAEKISARDVMSALAPFMPSIEHEAQSKATSSENPNYSELFVARAAMDFSVCFNHIPPTLIRSLLFSLAQHHWGNAFNVAVAMKREHVLILDKDLLQITQSNFKDASTEIPSYILQYDARFKGNINRIKWQRMLEEVSLAMLFSHHTLEERRACLTQLEVRHRIRQHPGYVIFLAIAHNDAQFLVDDEFMRTAITIYLDEPFILKEAILNKMASKIFRDASLYSFSYHLRDTTQKDILSGLKPMLPILYPRIPWAPSKAMSSGRVSSSGVSSGGMFSSSVSSGSVSSSGVSSQGNCRIS